MCGRYLTPDQTAFERHWGLAAPPDYFESFNAAPSQPLPVVRVDDDGNLDASLMTWGFQPPWAKRAWINARAETAFTTKAFASAAARRRCLVPAAGWYEWQGDAAPKQPYVCHLDGFVPFAFAGIWTGRKEDGEWHRSFAILTMEAEGALREIHHRRPVAVRPERYRQWMSAATPEAEARQVLDDPLDGIVAYPVSDYVNKPAHDDARCIRPLAETRGAEATR